MVESPFAFYRGSAIVQAHDLAGTPDSGLHMQICGDCHLANFGGFATRARLLFDVEQFRRNQPGSLGMGPQAPGRRALSLPPGICATSRAWAEDLVYQLAQLPGAHALLRPDGHPRPWYDRITFERLLEEETSPDIQKRIRRGIERAADRTSEALLPKLAKQVGEHWTILDAPPAVFHVRGEQTLFDPDDDWMKAKDIEAASEEVFQGLPRYAGGRSPGSSEPLHAARPRLQGGGRGQRRHALHDPADDRAMASPCSCK
ncbi:DUF2252 family protein [Cupriavidus basilensis]